MASEEIEALVRQQFMQIVDELQKLADVLDVDIPIVNADAPQFLRYAASKVRILYDEANANYRMCNKHAAEINRRRGEMAGIREYLNEIGVPQEVNGNRLSMLGRIVWLSNQREI